MFILKGEEPDWFKKFSFKFVKMKVRATNDLGLGSFVIIVLISLLVGGSKAEECKDVPGLGSAANIFHVYFQNFFDSMDLSNDKNGLELVTMTEQRLEAIVYRFIFKYNTNGQKDYFVGVLSTIPLKNLEQGDLTHKVIRFIQSSDINDAKRLIGLYDIDETQHTDCGYKMDFWSYLEANPFKISGGDIAVHKKQITEFDVAIENEKAKERETEEIQELIDLLENTPEEPVKEKKDNQPSLSNYDNSDDLNVTNQSDLLKQLSYLNETKARQDSLMELSLNESLKNMHSNQNATVVGNLIDSSFKSNNHHSSMNHSGFGDMNSIDQLLKMQMNNGNGGSFNKTTTRYSGRAKYKLGDVLSGNGEDKIMNPKKITEHLQQHTSTHMMFNTHQEDSDNFALDPDELMKLLQLQNNNILH